MTEQPDLLERMAMLFAQMVDLQKGQAEIKTTLKTMVPRLDTLVSEVYRLGERVHHHASLLQPLVSEMNLLDEARTLHEREVRALELKLRKSEADLARALQDRSEHDR